MEEDLNFCHFTMYMLHVVVLTWPSLGRSTTKIPFVRNFLMMVMVVRKMQDTQCEVTNAFCVLCNCWIKCCIISILHGMWKKLKLITHIYFMILKKYYITVEFRHNDLGQCDTQAITSHIQRYKLIFHKERAFLPCLIIYIYIYIYIQGVPGGKDVTSGECSLGQTIPI